LTNLANRRAIRTCLDDALAQAQRQHQSLGVMLLDIDDLKMLNDTRGEAEGDVVLQQVATRLTESIGRDDSVGRFAAGRFMIVVSACNMYETVMLAERIRKSLCDTPIDAGGGPIPISASVGVSAGLPEPNQVAKLLIEAAQRALHRAKAAGGNRVYLAASDSQAVVIGEKQIPLAETG
jgi:diguanylate cyclase (GGDEF)-like protein